MTGVDGWLLFTLRVILRLPPSVGVGGTAGGGITDEAPAEGDMAAEEEGRLVRGDIASGVATALPKNDWLSF